MAIYPGLMVLQLHLLFPIFDHYLWKVILKKDAQSLTLPCILLRGFLST
jgi:hypothetical protein